MIFRVAPLRNWGVTVLPIFGVFFDFFDFFEFFGESWGVGYPWLRDATPTLALFAPFVELSPSPGTCVNLRLSPERGLRITIGSHAISAALIIVTALFASFGYMRTPHRPPNPSGCWQEDTPNSRAIYAPFAFFAPFTSKLPTGAQREISPSNQTGHSSRTMDQVPRQVHESSLLSLPPSA